jgi:hypothetical protein
MLLRMGPPLAGRRCWLALLALRGMVQAEQRSWATRSCLDPRLQHQHHHQQQQRRQRIKMQLSFHTT